jgi:hypothetical protein
MIKRMNNTTIKAKPDPYPPATPSLIKKTPPVSVCSNVCKNASKRNGYFQSNKITYQRTVGYLKQGVEKNSFTAG